MKPDFLELFRTIGDAGVEYIVVGGVAAILEGAPITTLDLRVLELASIIESKVVADREKDRAMLPVLRRTLNEK